MKTGIAILMSILLVACSSSTYIVTGETRSPLGPEQVKVYHGWPRDIRYTEVAQITATASEAMTDQGDLDNAMLELRKRAGSLGANAVVVTRISRAKGADAMMINSSGGFGFIEGSSEHVVQGTAIHVD